MGNETLLPFYKLVKNTGVVNTNRFPIAFLNTASYKTLVL